MHIFFIFDKSDFFSVFSVLYAVHRTKSYAHTPCLPTCNFYFILGPHRTQLKPQRPIICVRCPHLYMSHGNHEYVKSTCQIGHQLKTICISYIFYLCNCESCMWKHFVPSTYKRVFVDGGGSGYALLRALYHR